jgi:hypothetical protein
MKYYFSIFTFLILGLIPGDTSNTSLYSAAVQNAGATDKSYISSRMVPFLHDDYEGDSLLIEGLKNESYLSAADIAYMHQQIKKNRAGMWQKDSLGNEAKILPPGQAPSAGLSPKKATKAWTNYFKKYPVGFYELSQPVFSKDGTVAAICVNFQCGVYCGNGGAYVFRFLNGQWTAVKNCYSWKK